MYSWQKEWLATLSLQIQISCDAYKFPGFRLSLQKLIPLSIKPNSTINIFCNLPSLCSISRSVLVMLSTVVRVSSTVGGRWEASPPPPPNSPSSPPNSTTPSQLEWKPHLFLLGLDLRKCFPKINLLFYCHIPKSFTYFSFKFNSLKPNTSTWRIIPLNFKSILNILYIHKYSQCI